MRRIFKGFSYGLLMLFLAISLFGCTMKMVQYEPNSHFAFPNSNVVPLGQVSAVSKGRVGIFSAKMVDKEMLDEVMNKALKAKGGDMLINYKLTTEVTIIPVGVTICITKVRVDGTACKMTVGRQELK